MTVRRLKLLLEWTFLAIVALAAGARNVGGKFSASVDMYLAILVVFGFLAWALYGYCRAWKRLVFDQWPRRAKSEIIPAGVPPRCEPEILDPGSVRQERTAVKRP